MPRKKIVFMIVEGTSDQEALGAILSRLFPMDMIHVHIVYGDITTSDNVTPDKIVAEIGKMIKQYADENHFKPEYFKEIVHIVDTDGTFIPDSNVIEVQNINDTVYTLTEIHTAHRQNILKRNVQKSSNLKKLIHCSKVWKVPYRVFYMSCNLDHVLHNKLNSSDEEKEHDSLAFADKYHKNTAAFRNYIMYSDFSVVENYTYQSSWDYIKRNLHSLERHSNFGLYLQNN